MSITSFDHFIETLEHVPAELQRNFIVMGDLDKREGDMVRRINECVKEYWRSDRIDERNSLYKESMELFDKARNFADDKIDLAAQTYDLVDKHIRRLESLSGSQNQTSENNEANHKTNSRTQKLGQNDGSTGNAAFQGSTGSGLLGTSISAEPLAVDMPLDPNEPKYCTCHQVSFGEMIACDNKDCPIEWFHFACVELKSKPKGKWYCPECFNINKKGKHRSIRRQKI